MIEIKDDDLPITAAAKIIAGTKPVTVGPMLKAAAKALTGIEHDGTTDMFSLEEFGQFAHFWTHSHTRARGAADQRGAPIEEIADYLKTYVEHHKNGD